MGKPRIVHLDEPRSDRDRDGANALRDVEAETGDEELLEDVYELDEAEARAMGVNLDSVGVKEPVLD